MVKFEPKYKRPFVHFVKKQHKPLQAVIEDEVLAICGDPRMGEAKLGDLAGIRVHKFTFKGQEYLIAYFAPEVGPREDEIVPEGSTHSIIEFYQIGPHEKFYENLKAYLKANGWYR